MRQKWLECTACKADARCLEVWSRIDGNNFLQRLPEDSHANKLQQVLVDSWTAPVATASLNCFEHGKMSIKKNKTKHWIVEDQKFFDIVTSAEDCKHSYRNQAKWFETAFYCWCHDTLSRLSMVSLSSWHSGQWRWHCRLRSGGQTVRATQQEEWRLPSQFPDECCSHGLGRLYHVTSSCFKVARLVLEGCLSQPYMNTT